MVVSWYRGRSHVDLSLGNVHLHDRHRQLANLGQRPDGEPFAFAGLWERWQPESGPPMLTCCIVTTTPNAVTGAVHNRMPVLFATPDQFAAWLDATATPDALQALLRPSY